MEHFDNEEEIVGYVLEEIVIHEAHGVIIFCPNATVCEQLDLAIQEAVDELDEPNFPFKKVHITDRIPTQTHAPYKHLVYRPK